MKKIILIALAAIGGIVVIVFAVVSLTTTGVSKKADSILTQFKNGDVEAVYNESAMKNDFTLAEFKEAMGIGSKHSIAEATKVAWTGKGFKNSEKYIYGDFKFPTGTVQTLTFYFVEDNGELKLLGILAGEPE